MYFIWQWLIPTISSYTFSHLAHNQNHRTSLFLAWIALAASLNGRQGRTRLMSLNGALGLDSVKCSLYNHTSRRGLGSKSRMKVNTFFSGRGEGSEPWLKRQCLQQAWCDSQCQAISDTCGAFLIHLRFIHTYIRAAGFYLPLSEFNTFIFFSPHFVILVRILVCTTREWSRSELGHLHHVVRIHPGTQSWIRR